ncbi:16S rRNA (cytidine(1402)-2'-O)-methyltransferase [Candidatus Uhrbacteria bacterium]|nr:16S rRNA (cytidine(1402)-2'-O)-methyltransferase [Candidatus Uhrbacteria bacterium]
MSGTLYIVATPIGNLQDITMRAAETMAHADWVACEDTRVSKRLFMHLKITKPLIALHEHSDPRAIQRLIDRLKKGESGAYMSDAGTPGVNDPGGKLVEACFAAGISVVPIPGPSALTAAISVCGFPMDEFVYLGFVPHKKGRVTMFQEVAQRDTPSIFFESTHRILKTFDELKKHLDPERLIFCGRELTKMHETLYRGTIDEVIKHLQATSIKGEFVLIIGPQ